MGGEKKKGWRGSKEKLQDSSSEQQQPQSQQQDSSSEQQQPQSQQQGKNIGEMSFTGVTQDRSMDEVDNVQEIGSCTRMMDIINIPEESEYPARENDVVLILEETIEEINKDISEVSESHETEKCMASTAEEIDGQPSKFDVAYVANKTQDCASTMDIDIADQIEELVSNLNVVTIEEEIKGCAVEEHEDEDEDEDDDEDEDEHNQDELSDNEITTFCKDACKAFFKEWGLISHQLNSFNDFISNGLQRIFDDLGEFEIEPDYNPQKKTLEGLWCHASVSFGEVTVEQPSYCTKDGRKLKIKPAEARLRNMTYSSPVYVDIEIKVYIQDHVKTDGKSKPSSSLTTKSGKHVTPISEEHKRVLIGRIPIMVKSHLCHLYGLTPRELLTDGDCSFDVGGYFIIKGHEKIFIGQEVRCTSRIWVCSAPCWMATYTPSRCRLGRNKSKITVKLEKTAKGKEVLFVRFFGVTVPLVLLFYALGVKSDREMMHLVGCASDDYEMSHVLVSSLHKTEAELKDFRNKKEVWGYINLQLKKSQFPKNKNAEEVLNAHLFPYIVGHKQKAMFLGFMVNCLLSSYFGRRQVENKDDYRNKRLELAGELLSRELEILLKRFRSQMTKQIQRDLSGRRDLKSIEYYIDASIITSGLVRAFSTGNWSHPMLATVKCTGVVASVKQINPLQVVSEMRKMRLRVQYAAKLGDARYPNPSYWGRVCFISTPDGENCGLVKNLAVIGLVSLNSAEEPVLAILNQCGISKLDQIPSPESKCSTNIFVNGEWVGTHDEPDSLVNKLRSLRRKRCINPQVEIKKDNRQNEIRIFSDAGRLLRPLFVVKNQRLCISKRQIDKFKKSSNPFQYLMGRGIIEILGVEEEEDAQIACGIDILCRAEKNPDYPQFSHCELDPSFLLSLNAGLIPFANHNLATRTLYQSEKHSRQAIGYYEINQYARCDTTSHQLFYPQRPLFKTMTSECLNQVQFYNGQNPVVAVNVHYGYNQEDSLVTNHASIDRGLFRSMHFHTFVSETDHDENRSSSASSSRLEVDFGKPQPGNLKAVDKLDADGLPFIASDLYSGDILIGKVGSQPSDANFSVKLKHTEKGRVDQVIMATNDDGKKFARVRLRDVRAPSLGDKFSSMHGQKGVVGFIEEQESMPFTKEGIVPDVIINPHAFPSRQTPGQLFECALGKAIASSGIVGDATPFRPITVENITERLRSCGYQQWGKEQMYNGRTGGKMQTKIFIGPTYYQRLIHMAEDKIKYRNHGPVHPLTRQPVADRKRHGGIKFGEMERDCMLAHGATANLMERLFYLSDFSSMHVCGHCHMLATVVQRDGIRGPYCPFCKTAKHVVKVNIPHACKLLYQELFSMGICLRFSTELC